MELKSLITDDYFSSFDYTHTPPLQSYDSLIDLYEENWPGADSSTQSQVNKQPQQQVRRSDITSYLDIKQVSSCGEENYEGTNKDIRLTHVSTCASSPLRLPSPLKGSITTYSNGNTDDHHVTTPIGINIKDGSPCNDDIYQNSTTRNREASCSVFDIESILCEKLSNNNNESCVEDTAYTPEDQIDFSTSVTADTPNEPVVLVNLPPTSSQKTVVSSVSSYLGCTKENPIDVEDLVPSPVEPAKIIPATTNAATLYGHRYSSTSLSYLVERYCSSVVTSAPAAKKRKIAKKKSSTNTTNQNRGGRGKKPSAVTFRPTHLTNIAAKGTFPSYQPSSLHQVVPVYHSQPAGPAKLCLIPFSPSVVTRNLFPHTTQSVAAAKHMIYQQQLHQKDKPARKPAAYIPIPTTAKINLSYLPTTTFKKKTVVLPPTNPTLAPLSLHGGGNVYYYRNSNLEGTFCDSGIGDSSYQHSGSGTSYHQDHQHKHQYQQHHTFTASEIVHQEPVRKSYTEHWINSHQHQNLHHQSSNQHDQLLVYSNKNAMLCTRQQPFQQHYKNHHQDQPNEQNRLNQPCSVSSELSRKKPTPATLSIAPYHQQQQPYYRSSPQSLASPPLSHSVNNLISGGEGIAENKRMLCSPTLTTFQTETQTASRGDINNNMIRGWQSPPLLNPLQSPRLSPAKHVFPRCPPEFNTVKYLESIANNPGVVNHLHHSSSKYASHHAEKKMPVLIRQGGIKDPLFASAATKQSTHIATNTFQHAKSNIPSLACTERFEEDHFMPQSDQEVSALFNSSLDKGRYPDSKTEIEAIKKRLMIEFEKSAITVPETFPKEKSLCCQQKNLQQQQLQMVAVPSITSPTTITNTKQTRKSSNSNRSTNKGNAQNGKAKVKLSNVDRDKHRVVIGLNDYLGSFKTTTSTKVNRNDGSTIVHPSHIVSSQNSQKTFNNVQGECNKMGMYNLINLSTRVFSIVVFAQMNCIYTFLLH